ncbi:energy transducer TonB family protein [Piscinibacter sp.]|uniref:energy transducer TonB family protein n=1 Tax=Piscinibacter sp. TaxID=1903157 RepID=UPI0039E237B5
MQAPSRVLLPLLASLAFAAQAQYEWPEPVVRIEDMRMLAPMRISVPTMRPRGEVRRPVVLRVHVDAAGEVRRVVLLESCGSPGHDEAAMHSMRAAKFAPKLIDGKPADVTMVVPLHLPRPRPASGS